VDEWKIESRKEGDPKTIVGHAAVFNRTDGPDWFREMIEPGAFRNSIEIDDIRALFNHNPDLVLGRNKAGTLKLEEDDEGLRMEITPPDTQVGRDLMTSIGRGDISQASFAFVATGEELRDIGDEKDVRVITKATLYDVSPVTYPFYEATDVSLRGVEAAKLRKEGAKQEIDRQTAKRKIAHKRRLLMLITR